jgi:hypothetical protein
MTIEVHDLKEFVYRWVECVSFHYELYPREIAVAKQFVLRYAVLSKAKENLKGKAAIDYNVMTEVKSKDSLTYMREELEMSFPVFKEYVRKLKSKGFFVDSTINSEFLVTGTEKSITVKWT